MSYDDNNKGALFTNDRKLTDRHPDFSGAAKVDGVEYFVSGWTNVAKSGKKQGQEFLSITFTRKGQQNYGASTPEPNRSGNSFIKNNKPDAAPKPSTGAGEQKSFEGFDDDIPF